METPRDIALLVLDVDGVLTDGSIVYDEAGGEIKRFHVRDGLGIKAWMRAGFHCAILSSRTSKAVARRMEELGVREVVQGSKDKSRDLPDLCARMGVDASRTAFLGDDLVDLPAMKLVGLGIAPSDADERVRRAAGMVTERPGGRGAVREAIERLLGARGLDPAELL